ncbi:MAG: alpha-amylase family glycosyl hydrolase [Acidimicrobiales bacterium]
MPAAWPVHPFVHEVFTWVWLGELGGRLGRRLTLADVPSDAWDDVARPGVDAVWLMGVWTRSPAGAAIARADPAMMTEFRAALPELTDDDVVGSAYCIRDYHVDPWLGGDEGLAARAALADRGVRLVLDFVPNHVAPDHPWVTEHPEYFIQGTSADLEADPRGFVAIGGHVFACGRDPYFPAWTDVVQLDASRGAVRRAAADLVSSIAERCDGVRCDMAMLVLDDVFTRTWGPRATGGPSPDDGRGYWPTVTGAVRARHPGFVFWAEAYWDTEPRLVAQGFDACYDKRLYDRLVHREPARSVLAHLGADPADQAHAVRFAENHDVPRLASVLDPAPALAAATAALTLPGVALLHEGQAEGRRVRVPVQLARRPREPVDADLRAWYDRLLEATGDGLRRGEWALARIEGWPDNRSCEHLVAWIWTTADHVELVVVNLSDTPADGRVLLDRVPSGRVAIADRFTGAVDERDGDDLAADGLYVGLDARQVHLLRWSTSGAG